MLRREHKVSNISSEAIFAIPAMKPSRVIIAVIFCLFLMLTDIKYGSGAYLRSLSYDLIKPVTLLTRIPGNLMEISTTFFSSRQTLDEKVEILEQENLRLEAINKSLEKFNAFSKQMLTAETPEIAAQVLTPNVEEITPETIAQDTEPPGETNVPEYQLELTLKNRAIQFDLKVTTDMRFQVQFNDLPFGPNYRAVVVSNIQDVLNLLNENRDNISITDNG